MSQPHNSLHFWLRWCRNTDIVQTIDLSILLWSSNIFEPRCNLAKLRKAFIQQEPLVVVELRRPPMTNVGTKTALTHDHCKHFQKSKHLWRSEVSWCDQTSIELCLGRRCDHQLAQIPKEAFSEVRVHAGTIQADFEVDRHPPAYSPPGDHLITMVRQTVKKTFQKMMKVKLVRISHWSDSDTNAFDCQVACDRVKRANIVAGLREEIFAKTYAHTTTHKPTSAQCLKVTMVTHTNTHPPTHPPTHTHPHTHTHTHTHTHAHTHTHTHTHTSI